jgi:mannitol/fructose-specific phosphotransferase system IIA component (Ntr-type)
MSYLSDLLRGDQIQLELRGAEKTAVLREMVELVPEIKNDSTQKDVLLKALLDRERLHTTGVGDGIALPHTRTPLGGFLKRPLIAFGRHTQGVPYGSLDNKPVQLLFLLASPNLTDHLAMLARLSRVLRDAKVRKGLTDARTPGEIIRTIDEGEQRGAK